MHNTFWSEADLLNFEFMLIADTEICLYNCNVNGIDRYSNRPLRNMIFCMSVCRAVARIFQAFENLVIKRQVTKCDYGNTGYCFSVDYFCFKIRRLLTPRNRCPKRLYSYK
jgi:hypothetical protein